MAPPIKKNIIGDKSRQTEKLQTCSTKNYFESEDEISKLLSLDKVETDFRSYVKQLRSILLTNTTNIRRQEFRDLLLIATVKLRNLNRHSNFYNKVHSSRLSGARSNIEAHYLSLQNVTNEITHLRKNIETCLEFQSSDADIELTDSIELNSNKNEEMNDHDHPSPNPHQVHLARLNYELNERKSMLANLQELEGRKSALLSDIRGKEQRLLQIRPKIGSIKRSVGPFLELLGVNIRSNCTSPKFNHQMLHLRPIFMNDDVCCEIFGSTFVELGVNSEVILDEPKMEVEQLSVSDVANNANNVPLSTANVGKFIAAEETLASLQQINVKRCELTTLIKSMIMGNDLFSDSIIQEFFQRAILLRRLYRQVNIQNRMSYKKLSELRSKLEQHSTELYTQTAQIVYLKKSIEILTDQKSSQDLDIELIPVKEFYSELPISVSRPDITKNDAHKLHLLRLKHELATRKNLLENVQKLENDKKALLTSISAIERTFTKIDPRVENLKKISKPLFDIVGLKSIALSVHNKEVPFRPVKIDNETIKEIFGGNLQEDGVNNRGMIEEDEHLEDLEQEIAMQIDDV